jgi:hypothetical protein
MTVLAWHSSVPRWTILLFRVLMPRRIFTPCISWTFLNTLITLRVLSPGWRALNCWPYYACAVSFHVECQTWKQYRTQERWDHWATPPFTSFTLLDWIPATIGWLGCHCLLARVGEGDFQLTEQMSISMYHHVPSSCLCTNYQNLLGRNNGIPKCSTAWRRQGPCRDRSDGAKAGSRHPAGRQIQQQFATAWTLLQRGSRPRRPQGSLGSDSAWRWTT